MEEISVIVPFDNRNGQVYLNSIGATRDEAIHPFVVGCFEITSDELEFIDTVEASVRLADSSHDPDDFPVMVPISKHDGKPVLCGIGCDVNEVSANLIFNNLEFDNHFIEAGFLVMPQHIRFPGLPSH